MTTCPASVADLRPSGYLRPSLPPFLLSPFLSPSRAPLFLPRRGVRGRRVLPPAPSDSAASGRVWACAAPPRARLRVCVCVCERGRGTIWCGFSSSLAPGKASAGGGAARRSLPTCILALLRFHPFLRCACEHVRWRRRAGGRLGLPAALGGFLRLRRYCPFPPPPSRLQIRTPNHRLVCRDLRTEPPLCRRRYLLPVRQQPVRQVLRVTCSCHTSLDHSITPLTPRRTAGDAFPGKRGR